MVKVAPSKPRLSSPKSTTGKAGEAATMAGGGSSKKSSKKAAAAAASNGGGSVGKDTAAGESGARQPTPAAAAAEAAALGAGASANGEPVKPTCTCPHLVGHPDRADLLRKLVDVRIEVRSNSSNYDGIVLATRGLQQSYVQAFLAWHTYVQHYHQKEVKT